MIAVACWGAPTIAMAAPTRAVRLADARPAVELKAQQEKTDQALARRQKVARAAKEAAGARDKAASTVAKLKQRGERGPLEAALQQALAKDEAAARARSAVAAADADVAREGARLLRLSDAVLAERRRAVDAAPAARRQEAVDAYRALVAHRDAVRAALAPVLAPAGGLAEDAANEGASAGLDVGADDDVEALLEKADLARDLEARLLRRADAVRRRISELKDEASLEGDVAASLARGQLFDEEDRRLSITRADLGTSKPVGLPVAGNPQDRGTTNDGSGGAFSSGGNEAFDVSDGPAVEPGFVSGAVVSTTGPTSTAERPVSLPTELQTSTAPSSLSELQAQEQALQKQLAALKQKQAALKKAAQDRARPRPLIVPGGTTP